MSTAHNDPRILRGMETQLKNRQLQLEAGKMALGWKVGFGAPAAMEQLNIDAPLIGYLTDTTLLPSEGTASITGWTRAIAEPEIAVCMGDDLDNGADRKTARAAIAAIGPVIELADVHFPPVDIEAILAGNVYHRHIILGRSDTSWAGCVLDGLVGRVFQNGIKVAETTELQTNTGDLIDIVRHVADMLNTTGQKLRKGEIIITGSIVPPVPINRNDHIRFSLDPIDTVAIHIEA